MNDELQKLQDKIVVMLRTVYDPEIPVNIYDLGLIYDVDIDDANNVTIEMTFTSPSCPAADFILMDVQMKVESIPEVNNVDLNLTFDPPWDKSMMSEEALLELGFM
ncbi:MAG: iron-sulfur cluster assembly protein [Bacteroidia bacterium]|nr:iron-sulfur cluster assembly protein [Bacteroidia bacterium]